MSVNQYLAGCLDLNATFHDGYSLAFDIKSSFSLQKTLKNTHFRNFSRSCLYPILKKSLSSTILPLCEEYGVKSRCKVTSRFGW